MVSAYARVIEDSAYRSGTRLTTFEIKTWRFVLAEFNTHRMFSRNSASSRAIPIRKQLERIQDDPAIPLKWPSEQKGMQGGEELDLAGRHMARSAWEDAKEAALESARELMKLGVHKSVTNRILEPYMWHTIVVTATGYDNFFKQRCSPLAQPEIRYTADLMHHALKGSVPRHLEPGDWHLPYMRDEDWDWASDLYGKSDDVNLAYRELAKVSAARCARTSYLTQGGIRDVQEDLNLFKRLIDADPKHWSPLEHPATPWKENRQQGSMWTRRNGSFKELGTGHLPRIGNLVGWRSLRTEEEILTGEKTYV
jgi:hypothetical protein